MVTEQMQGTLYSEPDLRPKKTLRIAVSGDVLITETEKEIIDTSAFQRLRRIKQLGTSYLVYPSATHTRFEHSLGTLKMADLMVQKILDCHKLREAKGNTIHATINDRDRQIIRLTALLHDITQIPFGHTLEDESCVIEKDHDSDEERYKYFLGADSDIGRILLPRIGREGYELLVKVLKTKRINIESLGDKAYISDIVKNTVCADLLDYLRRDAYYCNLNLDFGDRFLNFLFLAPVPIKSSEYKGKDPIRLVVGVWKDKEKKHRRDIIDELIQLLNCRFYVGSAVYFHHAKIITSAIISRAVKQALDIKIFKREDLWNMGDDELLYRLSKSKDPVAKRLAECILNRTFYEDFYEFTRAEAQAVEGVNLLNILEKKFHGDPSNRTNEENKLSEVCKDGEIGDVLIYCPEKEMALKEAEVLVQWKQSYVPLGKIEDKLITRKIGSILASHEQLWSLKVFVSTKLMEKTKNNSSNENLLRSWCNDLVKQYIDADRHSTKTAVSIMILDILENKKIVSPNISQEISKQVLTQIERVRGESRNDPIDRKTLERIIDTLLPEKEQGNEEQ